MAGKTAFVVKQKANTNLTKSSLTVILRCASLLWLRPSTCVTRIAKTSLDRTFYIMRNTNLKY